MRVVSIDSVSAKLDKLIALEASLVKRLEDVRAQIAEQKIKKNELIAQKITSQVGNLNEDMLQEILKEYNKRIGSTDSEASQVNPPSDKNVETKEIKKEEKQPSPATNDSNTTNTDKAIPETGSNNQVNSADTADNDDDIKPFELKQSGNPNPFGPN